jgi:hypothetical protein
MYSRKRSFAVFYLIFFLSASFVISCAQKEDENAWKDKTAYFTPLGSFPAGTDVGQIVGYQESNPFYIWAVRENETGNFCSPDGGLTWEKANYSIANFTGNVSEVKLYQVAPDASGALWALLSKASPNYSFLAPEGVVKSLDGGSAWELQSAFTLPPDASECPAREVLFRKVTDSLFLLQDCHGFFASADGGASWTEWNCMGGEDIQSLAVSPQGMVAAAGDHGLLLSRDSGATWNLYWFAGSENETVPGQAYTYQAGGCSYNCCQRFNSVYFTSSGELWVSRGNGLLSRSQDGYHYHSFNAGNGVPSSIDSIFVLPDGGVYLYSGGSISRANRADLPAYSKK